MDRLVQLLKEKKAFGHKYYSLFLLKTYRRNEKILKARYRYNLRYRNRKRI